VLTKSLGYSSKGDSNVIRPLADRIVVKAIIGEEKTRGGIVIPDSAKEKPQDGEVMAVGPGKILENGTVSAPEVKVGDHIIFNKYSGTEIKVDGETYLILRESDILAIK
jgi:chaperonin GroES